MVENFRCEKLQPAPFQHERQESGCTFERTDGFCSLSPSQHDQSSVDLRDTFQELVVCWTSWFSSCHCFPNCSAGKKTFSLVLFLNDSYFLHLWSVLMEPILCKKVASTISAMATWPFAGIRSIGWGWTGVIWIFNIVTYMLLDPIKFAVRYALSGKSWNRMIEQRVRFVD